MERSARPPCALTERARRGPSPTTKDTLAHAHTFCSYQSPPNLREKWIDEGEAHTNLSRIDLVMQQPQYTFIFELKVDQPAAVALDQLHTRRYQERYLKDGKDIVAIAISFSTQTRNIAEYKGGRYTPTGQLV